jgi:hypothetical protein
MTQRVAGFFRIAPQVAPQAKRGEASPRLLPPFGSVRQSVAYAYALEARALDALGTLAAIAVVKTGLPSRSLRGDIVISIIRSRVADANTILARGAGQLVLELS